jgi:hypothetical protein
LQSLAATTSPPAAAAAHPSRTPIESNKPPAALLADDEVPAASITAASAGDSTAEGVVTDTGVGTDTDTDVASTVGRYSRAGAIVGVRAMRRSRSSSVANRCVRSALTEASRKVVRSSGARASYNAGSVKRIVTVSEPPAPAAAAAAASAATSSSSSSSSPADSAPALRSICSASG